MVPLSLKSISYDAFSLLRRLGAVSSAIHPGMSTDPSIVLIQNTDPTRPNHDDINSWLLKYSIFNILNIVKSIFKNEKWCKHDLPRSVHSDKKKQN